MAEGDVSITGAASRLGIRQTTLRVWMRKLGIASHSIGSLSVLTAEQFAALQEYRREWTDRITLTIAAKRLSMNLATLTDRMKILGISPETIGPSKILSEEQFAAIDAHDRREGARKRYRHPEKVRES
jgi:transposase-like protein